MYGDPSSIRWLAASVRERGDDVRREAARLVGLLDRSSWTGQAAEAARHRARDRAGDLGAVAVRHDDAAQSLLEHAREVERRQELIARAERVAARLLEAGADLVLPEHGPTGLALPDPGHRDWLDVDLTRLLA